MTTTTCSALPERLGSGRYSKRADSPLMRSHLRTALVLALVVGLLALFLHNVDLGRVGGDILRARPLWLVVAVGTMFVNLAIRALRWQYLLEPLGSASFANAFRATAVGFAASGILPARAGEVIRPYFLARRERLSAAAAARLSITSTVRLNGKQGRGVERNGVSEPCREHPATPAPAPPGGRSAGVAWPCRYAQAGRQRGRQARPSPRRLWRKCAAGSRP